MSSLISSLEKFKIINASDVPDSKTNLAEDDQEMDLIINQSRRLSDANVSKMQEKLQRAEKTLEGSKKTSLSSNNLNSASARANILSGVLGKHNSSSLTELDEKLERAEKYLSSGKRDGGKAASQRLNVINTVLGIPDNNSENTALMSPEIENKLNRAERVINNSQAPPVIERKNSKHGVLMSVFSGDRDPEAQSVESHYERAAKIKPKKETKEDHHKAQNRVVMKNIIGK
ncbi:hypothetical protein HDV06_003136 [Boothiomyces sp. JEL0866]|nr:hypothetical protein HDV06_003119 [Boothiomyces sp. JEL0866]KAJ3322416.1 hypothetical protein HDV06_003136 [Boothiomyces sp. JEL0866]